MPSIPPAADKSHKPEKPRYWVLEVALAIQSEELWSLYCYDLGAVGAEQVAHDEQMLRQRYFFDAPPCWKPQDLLKQFASDYPGVALPHDISLTEQPSEDWASAWRVHFKPLPVGNSLLVCPPWEVPEQERREGRKVLIVEPGQGFGTGAHATTSLALELLERQLAGAQPAHAASTVLDVGAGSGILAIAAGILGAASILAIDIDPVALPEVRANAAANGLGSRIRAVVGDADCVGGVFGLVLANIVAPVLVAQRERLVACVGRGGTLLLSGILIDERHQLIDAYSRRGMVIIEQAERDEWWACTLRRRP